MPEEHVYLDAFTQQLVDPDQDLLTILLPILPSNSELGYVLNQMHTFSRFADMGSILEYLIVTPTEFRCAHALLTDQMQGVPIPLGYATLEST